MNLHDLTLALAEEVEAIAPELQAYLQVLEHAEAESDDFLQALDAYCAQVQRMAEAAQTAGFEALAQVCQLVLENALLLALSEPAPASAQRSAGVSFLRAWPPLLVSCLRQPAELAPALALSEVLQSAPSPLPQSAALELMYGLGRMGQQVQVQGLGPGRPAFAQDAAEPEALSFTVEAVALHVSAEVDAELFAGFCQEAPQQAQRLVQLTEQLMQGGAEPLNTNANANADARMGAWAELKRVAHTLKGTGAIIGLHGVMNLAHLLEDLLEQLEAQEKQGIAPASALAELMRAAAQCLAQMVGAVIGQEEVPAQALQILQALHQVQQRWAAGLPITEAELLAQWMPAGQAPLVPAPEPAGFAATQGAMAAALRITQEQMEEWFRLTGEVAVAATTLEGGVKKLNTGAQQLVAQQARVHQRLLELEAALDARSLTQPQVGSADFDALEMDQYSLWHSSMHALSEDASDARLLMGNVLGEVAALSAVQLRQRIVLRELQHQILSARMSPASLLQARLQRSVSATAQATGKEVELALEGGETLMDAAVLSSLADALMHLLRNAVDHGIEAPVERLAAGKPARGRIRLEFSRQGSQVRLRCTDDGRGLDLAQIRLRAQERGLLQAEQVCSEQELARLIFAPGFSTRQTVDEISGRGVGLDVVHAWVATVGGSLDVASTAQQSTCFTLHFAASMAMVPALLVQVGAQCLALPATVVEQALPRGLGQLERTDSGAWRYRHAGQEWPAHFLGAALGHMPELAEGGKAGVAAVYDMVLVRLQGQTLALAVDALLDVRELLVKKMGRFSQHAQGAAGLSILGDGRVAVHVDLAEWLARDAPQIRHSGNTAALPSYLAAVLVVDDALTVRRALRQLLQDAGYRVETARDGMDALERLKTFRPDMVLTDLEMPNLNGVELAAHLRARPEWAQLPILLITSRSQDKHRVLAEQAGITAYITKPYRDLDLLQTLQQTLQK